MEAKDIMSKFDELYGMMASSTNVKYMRTFGDTMRCMMKDMASKHPELAQEYVENCVQLSGRTISLRRRLQRL